jgi:hypothetical protein
MRKKRTRAVADRGPSKESLREIPEVDFSRGIRPHRYAQLQTGYKHHVFIDRDTFEFFGSAEAINEALRFLVKAATKASTRRPKSRSGTAA